MALTLYWRCEGTTLDATHDFSAADTTAATNNSPSLDAAAAKLGSTGILINGVSERYDFAPTSIISPATGTVAFWFRFMNSMVNLETFFLARGSASSNDSITIGIGAGNDEVFLGIRRNGGTNVTLTTSAANMTTNTWYFIVASWDQPNSDRRIAVYDSSGTLLSENIDTTTAYDQPTALDASNGIRFGDSSGWGATKVCHFDNIFIGSAYADGDTFFSNRDITSYTSYSTGGNTNLTVEYASAVLEPFVIQLNTTETFTLPVTAATGVAELQDLPFILTNPGEDASFVLQGSDVQLLFNEQFSLSVDPASGTGAGQNITLNAGFSLPVDYAQLVLAAQDVSMILPFTLGASRGNSRKRALRQLYRR